jgi:hypothetical protein
MRLINGKFMFVYNVGNRDIRTYTIKDSGVVLEKIAKTGEEHPISTSIALDKLEQMIEIAQKERAIYKSLPNLDKTSKTKLDMLYDIKRFMLANPTIYQVEEWVKY